ncbi:putative quinol monooxygenase [Yersinia alsatica]|uniref:Antibiotic biosynthesis monooxygenase n=1 Tax=Yersinia alsatica TaxID=2890317 RepID=A0ABY5UTZ1_9GAMM|nr:putative quinol monooxygenase [Yersinia alsatica]OWF69859.1 antibiotic biosynthesis monooxygenase [Yersinia frederiksenii]UWM46399.1 antibiotic biosynthesis monooxygenase [Yersinia alsatica]CNK49780.1 ygin protei involved in menadione metabolism [Yersinia frederiksenii]CNL29919.1 ygin protei involved in menadione metabolism [Yersinia frederiksenii]
MITVFAEIKVKPGRRQAVLQAIEKLQPAVLAEEGCGGYAPMIDAPTQLDWQKKSPDSIFMMEKWQSVQHLEQHLQMEHMHQHREVVKDDVLDVMIYILDNA